MKTHTICQPHQSKRDRSLVRSGAKACKCLLSRDAALAVLLLLASGMVTAETVTLTGQTRLPQLPGAEVTVWVGDQTSTHSADDTGAFSAELTFTPGAELVRIEACGAGDQAAICHVRLDHSSAEIEQRAGVEQVYITGDLSPLSTAAWASLRLSIPGNVVPSDLAEIEDFRRSFVSSTIGRYAAILSLIAEGAAPLPEGAETLVDVVLDRDLLGEALNSIDSGVRDQREEALVQNDNLMRIPDDDFALAQTGYFVPLSNPDTSGARAFEITLDGAGDGFYAEWTGSGSVEWANVHAGEVIFADDMEAVGTGTRYVSLTAPDRDSIIPPQTFFFLPPGENQSVEAETRLEEVRWRELDASEVLRLALVRDVQNGVAPDRPDLDPEEIDSLGIRFADSYAISRPDSASVPPSPVPVAGSNWVFPRCDTDCRSAAGLGNGANVDLIGFNLDGTASSEIVDPGLTWTQSGQRTIIEQGDETVVEVVPFGSTAMHIGDLETTRVVARSTRADGQTLMTSQLTIEADPAFNFSADTLPGRYESMSPFGGVFVLEPDGTGWQASLDDPAASRPATGGFDVEWSIEPTGDLLLAVKQRDTDFTLAWWALRPVREATGGFYAIQRLGFFGGPVIDSAGTLLFWREVM